MMRGEVSILLSPGLSTLGPSSSALGMSTQYLPLATPSRERGVQQVLTICHAIFWPSFGHHCQRARSLQGPARVP